MKQRTRTARTVPAALVAVATAAALGGCGSDDSSMAGPTTSDVDIRFSDAPVDTADKVVVTVERLHFVSDDETVTVDTFVDGADTFTIDLLEVQGEDNRLVLDSVELPVGSYRDLRLEILDEDVNYSYVEEMAGGPLKPIKVPSGELKLGGFDVEPRSTQTFVIEFGLRQSLTYNPGPDRYILKPRGVRIVGLERATTVAGTVDLTALHLQEGCDAVDPGTGDAVYLYPGVGLDAAALADDFDADIARDADGRIAPLASAMLGSDGSFTFAYLEPGAYTVAATCTAAADDPDRLDDRIVVPQPSNQIAEATLERGERAQCTLGNAEPSCTVVVSDVVDDADGSER